MALQLEADELYEASHDGDVRDHPHASNAHIQTWVSTWDTNTSGARLSCADTCLQAGKSDPSVSAATNTTVRDACFAHDDTCWSQARLGASSTTSKLFGIEFDWCVQQSAPTGLQFYTCVAYTRLLL
jgi:hypothetical protein